MINHYLISTWNYIKPKMYQVAIVLKDNRNLCLLSAEERTKSIKSKKHFFFKIVPNIKGTLLFSGSTILTAKRKKNTKEGEKPQQQKKSYWYFWFNFSVIISSKRINTPFSFFSPSMLNFESCSICKAKSCWSALLISCDMPWIRWGYQDILKHKK